MDAVALLVNGQQVGRSQKASGGRWTRSFPPRLTVHGKDSPRERPSVGTSQPERGMLQDTGDVAIAWASHLFSPGMSWGLTASWALGPDKARAHGTRFWDWEELKYHNLKDLRP